MTMSVDRVRPAIQTKFWLFTQFNINEIPRYHGGRMHYLVYQREVCPETGRMHFQGYCEFRSNQRLEAVRRLFPGAHLERRYGTQEQAIAYCTKDETRAPGSTPIICGVPTLANQGARNDLLLVKNDIESGCSMMEVFEKHFNASCKYHKFFEKYKSMLINRDYIPLFRTVHVMVLWGDTGIGKTRKAYDLCPDLFKMPFGDSGTLWFDGYAFETTILLDEFYGQVKLSFFLQLLDGYPLRLPIKGSHTYAAWTKVIITSNVPPDQWYKGVPDASRRALMRRINSIEHLTHPVLEGVTADDLQYTVGAPGFDLNHPPLEHTQAQPDLLSEDEGFGNTLSFESDELDDEDDEDYV